MKKYFVLLIAALSVCACKTSEKILYLQDALENRAEKLDENLGIVIQPKDMLSVIVSSKDPELAIPFNLPLVSYQAGTELTVSGAQQKLLGYVVDRQGNIDFPVLGRIHVAGLTRAQLSEKIKNMIIGEDYIKDPVVTVQFLNFKIYVLGEVGAPGAYEINGDRVTILEAISMARDLTIFGKRDKVSVIREKDGSRIIYYVDLRSVKLFDSPVYYLQQNDIIYVEPNKVRAGQSTLNENSFKSVSLWVSITSLLASLIVLFTK